ncbi:TPA: hypothetical protein JRS27_004806 [Escherichia coli]|nr:hypothetical protein [Escherichia coli]
MLQLYDLNKVKIKGLRLYKDMNIESVLSSGDKTLSFLYPSRLSKDIKEECYIRTKKDEFVVKEISTNGEWNSIKATLNVEALEGQAWEHFDTTEKTISECLTLAVAGTGWTVQVNGVTKRRTIRKTNCSTWDIIQQAKKTYLVEIEFDTINKVVKVAEKLGTDKGVYFMDSLNLRNLDVQSNSYDFFTRIIAIGKDDLKTTIENFQYSSKKKTFIWKDERYTDINSLTVDATKKLEEISKPYKAYGADIIDLANTSNKYSILSYGLGDTIALISKDKGIKEKQRIVKITEYPEEPHRNSCEIANSILSFADVQKEYNDTMDTVSNITEDNGTVSEGAIRTAVEHLTVNKLDVGSLNAVEIRVGNLEATSATITQLKAVNASIINLQANKANITDLTASVGRIEILESSVGDIETLVNGNLTSNNIQSLILSSDKVTVVNGFIKNAMIENLDVSKINAGDISVNKFRIKSDSGNLLIFDNTIQIKDSTRVRVQIGKDASNDYNMYVWDSSGKLMFDATGLKADGIKNKIIRDDMVSDTANISGNKLNISSVVTSINNGATTINSSKVLLDGTAQTLDVAFNTLTTKVDSAPPSITIDSSITKLDGAIDGMLKINSISGNTLQNLSPKGLTNTTKSSDGYFTSTIPTYDYLTTDMTIFKPGTLYTIIVEVVENTLSSTVIGVTSKTSTTIWNTVNTIQNGFVGKKIFTAQTKADFTGCLYGFWLNGGNPSTTTGGFKLRIMILEGDWTNKEIPYFEGIRSVSENGEASEIVSKGENLLDINKIKDSGKTRSDVVGDTVTVSSFEAYAWLRSSVECKVKPNTDYYCDFEISDTTNGFVNINTPLGFLKDLGIKGGTFNSGNNSKIIIGLYATTTTAKINNVTYSNLRLTEGNTSKPYEPYKEHRQLITLTNPLRGLPNGVRDIVDFERGVVVRNVGKVVFDGGESWSIATSDPNNHIYTKVLKCKAGHNQYLICDKYSNSRVSWPLAPPNTVCTSSSIDGQIGFNFLIGTYTIATWKAELQANPITVYYQLATPVEEPIDVTQYMKQFNGGHFLTESSLINPTVDLTYSTSLASALSTMKEVTESNTTALNIQQGKIDSLISNTTIIKDGQNIQLKDAYNSTVATVNSINSVISEHTSTINNLTGQVTGVETKTNEVRRDLDGTIEIVSQTKVTAESALSTATEAKQTADGFTQRVSNIETNYATTQAMNSAISQNANKIKLEVSNDFVSKNDATLTYATKASMELTANQLKLDFFSIDIINLLSNSSFSNRETTGWNMSGIGLYTGNANFFMPTDGWRAFSLTSDRGLLYQKGMIGERLPKRNSQYTFSLSSITESNIETFRLYIDYKLGASYVANQVINLKTGYNINRYSVTFTTKDINYDTFLLYIEVKPKAGTTGYRVFSIGLPCLSKGENGSYTARQNEVISGSTEIDANGVTIYNGAIDVRNRAGNSVLKGDANGNLMVRGNLYADPANPILHLFGGCSIDATYNNEQGVGSAVRLKWDENSYIRIDTGSTDIYQNGIARFRFNPNYLDCKPPTIYFADQCKIDASAGTFRFYISKSVDTGIRISPDGTISFMIAGTPRHVFNTNGTKAGGTIAVDGATLGMSPIDSPKVLLEDVLFDIDAQEEGTTVLLDSTFLKTISTYAVFCSDPSVNIVSKDKTSFTVRGYTGKVDFRVIGYRIGYEEQYYQVVG